MSFIGLPRVKSPATVFPPPPTPATPTSPPEMNGGTPTPRDIEKHLSSLRPSVAPTAVATPDDTGQPGAGTPTSADEKAEEGAGGRRKRKRKRRARERAEELLETLRPTLMLVNSGSVARDHLASERTFLAYVRTSIGLSTMGVALVQLLKISASTADPDEIKRFARPLGSLIVMCALFTLCIGCWRYFAIQRMLVVGKFPATRMLTTVLSIVIGAITVIIFGILVAVRSATES